ncbi:GNAT family N-acetyltransferase [Haloferula sp. BvORR071]|uniref:GNAT family N-acetyltransferase n=1 Tax=Haloferula sp. BvORR071 TaxID=1396141 RepID=UPI000697282F|nr:GNAT family N-acetyltransferase [Haloferula sp. BvORR071]
MIAPVTRLDAPRPADFEVLLRLFTEPAVRAHLGGPLSPADAERRVNGILADRTGEVQTVRASQEPDAEAIGLVWLAPHHEEADLEFSILLLPEWQGRGHGFRSGTQVLRRAFREFRLLRVVAETRSANAPCIALLERLGMRFDRSFQRFGAEQSLYAISNPAF